MNLRRGVILLLISACVAPAAGADAGAPVIVTPDNLDELLFKGNADVAKQMNNVLRAKDNVAVALGNLIPTLSLNVGAVVANPPFFLVSSVSCLVPFLFPSSWYGYDAAKKQARAEASALEITKLNAFAAAEALLIRFSNDDAVLGVLSQQFARVEAFVAGQREKFAAGQLPELDVLRAQLDRDKFAIEVSKMSEAVGIERAAMRKMLGLSVEQPFEARFGGESESALESEPTTETTIDRVFEGSPEHRQLTLLLESAKALVTASHWTFLDSCSGSQGSWGPTGSNAFTFSGQISFSIGYGTFPQVDLSRRNLQDVVIRQRELRAELERLLEATERSAAILKARLVEADDDSLQVARQILANVELLVVQGKATGKDVLDSANAVARAEIERITALSTIDGHRVTLKRLGIEGRFSELLVKSRREIEAAAARKPRRKGD